MFIGIQICKYRIYVILTLVKLFVFINWTPAIGKYIANLIVNLESTSTNYFIYYFSKHVNYLRLSYDHY